MGFEPTAGRILRRGMDGLTPSQFKYLLDNAEKVDEIIADINARRDVYLETVKMATARVEAAEKAEAALAESKALLVKSQADLDTATAEAAAKHQGDIDALTRRTREVVGKEAACEERTTALDAREQEIEDTGRAHEEEHRGRLEALEAQETAAEEREQALHRQAADLDNREKRIKTAASMVKSAAASLG